MGGDATYTKDAQQGIWYDFEPVPVDAILGLIQDELA
jgi:hypothetical protein